MSIIVRKLCMITMITALLLLNIAGSLSPKSVKASENTENLATTYLNTTIKYLYLGEPGKTEFDFNINNKAIDKGATYSWYVNRERGNPETVSIEEESGKVTARTAGTAYIGCKITRLDGTFVHPEAKVTVINNITKIGLKRIPADNTISVGIPFYLDYKILNTKAGKNEVTEAVVKYDIEEVSAWTECSDQGVLVAYKEGEFRIRVVSFQNDGNYKRWSKNKSVNKSLLTASSEWITIKVISQAKEAIATNQKQLEELLELDTVDQVIIRMEKEQSITIPKGNYSDKTLVVEAPKANITNNGLFRLITINDMSTHVWIECSTENQVVVNSEYINIKVEKEATIKSLITGVETKKGFINVEGTLEKLYFNASNSILVSSSDNGSLRSRERIVENSVMLHLLSTSAPSIILSPSAVGSSMEVNGKGFSFIDNESESSIPITIDGVNYCITAGSTFLIDQLPEPTDITLYTTTPKVLVPVSTTSLLYNQKLSNSILEGTFIDEDNNIVKGELVWNTPDVAVKTAGIYAWTFIPYSRINYTIVTGVIVVNVR